jgi:uncharacterized iron-regulated protein
MRVTAHTSLDCLEQAKGFLQKAKTLQLGEYHGHADTMSIYDRQIRLCANIRGICSEMELLASERFTKAKQPHSDLADKGTCSPDTPCFLAWKFGTCPHTKEDKTQEIDNQQSLF